MKIYIKSSKSSRINVDDAFRWKGFYYGSKQRKSKNGSVNKFYKSMDDEFLVETTDEISADEYFDAADQYAKVFRSDSY